MPRDADHRARDHAGRDFAVDGLPNATEPARIETEFGGGRALLMQPRLLLLDEPLASLDRKRKQEILPYFERLRDEAKVPMIYVSHDADEVRRIASRVVLLDDGRVTKMGGVELLH